MGVWSELENFNSEQSLHIKKSGNGHSIIRIKILVNSVKI